MKVLGVIWASPVTLPALLIAVLFCARQANLRYRQGAFDCSGPSAACALTWLPTDGRVAWITVGQVIFSRDEDIAATWGAHERIHVR